MRGITYSTTVKKQEFIEQEQSGETCDIYVCGRVDCVINHSKLC